MTSLNYSENSLEDKFETLEEHVIYFEFEIT